MQGGPQEVLSGLCSLLPSTSGQIAESAFAAEAPNLPFSSGLSFCDPQGWDKLLPWKGWSGHRCGACPVSEDRQGHCLNLPSVHVAPSFWTPVESAKLCSEAKPLGRNFVQICRRS